MSATHLGLPEVCMLLTRRDFLRGDIRASVMFQSPEEATVDPVVHLMNRITFGPRPGDITHARNIGLEAILDEQLNPDSLDDSETDDMLRRLPILTMDRATLHRLDEYRVHKSLVQGMVTRAVHSRRQLLERMVDFWTDHFNIPAEDYPHDVVIFQREAIRKHALCKFQDLLIATAKSPAMLFYLDNFANIAESPNENYARELLELHTMGVDGGYTEQDVKEVARAFTAWTVHDGTPTGFHFHTHDHDTDGKVILGHRLPAGRGIEDGFHVLSLLAHHPSTAQYVCRKLCVRFVSDNPPQSLVDSLATVWQETDGDIKAILRHLFLSDEFYASAGQKLRRPLEFFVGALRATGTKIGDWWQLEEMLMELGQFPYGWHPPNGYPDVAGAWMSTNGLLARWNVAMRLTHGAYSDMYDLGYGLTTEIRKRIGEPNTVGAFVDAVASQIFGVPLAGADRQSFLAYLGYPESEPATLRLIGRKLGSLYGLMLASPQYQWR